MRKSGLAFLAVLASAVLLAGCSGSPTPAPPPGSAKVSLSITDTPPANAPIFSFEITITSAVLHSDTGKPDVSLITSPLEIEVKRLETEAAFLNISSITPDRYKSIDIGFANPELTFQNNTGATLLGCANGSICEVKPSVAGTVTIATNPPFPLTINANQTAGLLVDVNLSNLLDNSLGINLNAAGGIRVTLLGIAQGTGELEELEDLTGIVANKSTNPDKFTLQTTQGNFPVDVPSNTEFDDFTSCAADNFTCVQNGQLVEVDLRLLASGAFAARKIELEDNVADDDLDLVISSVDSASQFKGVIVEEMKNLAGVDVGNPITVVLQTGATFEVDTNGLGVPSSQLNAFTGASDTSQLLVGQRVEVRVRSLTTGPPITVQTDRVRLRFSRFTARVFGAPAPPFFNVVNFPFASLSFTQILVQTSSGTEFEGVTGLSGLADGDTVSLRGLLFQASPNPILIADKIRKRTP